MHFQVLSNFVYSEGDDLNNFIISHKTKEQCKRMNICKGGEQLLHSVDLED